jgi:hypothetical protein
MYGVLFKTLSTTSNLETTCPFCNAASAYPQDECCEHKLAAGNDWGGWLFLHNPGEEERIYSYGNDGDSTWDSLCDKEEAIEGLLEALAKHFEADPLCKKLIREHFARGDRQFPLHLCKARYVRSIEDEDEEESCYTSDHESTYFAASKDAARTLVDAIDKMAKWLWTSNLCAIDTWDTVKSVEELLGSPVETSTRGELEARLYSVDSPASATHRISVQFKNGEAHAVDFGRKDEWFEALDSTTPE